MLAVVNPSVATEIPGREHSLPQGEVTRSTLTTSAFFVSPPVPARVCGERCLAVDSKNTKRRHERTISTRGLEVLVPIAGGIRRSNNAAGSIWTNGRK
jgi:hypothetical protein